MHCPSQKIYLKKSPIAGRGVFAKLPIKKDELIEVAPVIVVPQEERFTINKDLKRYVFKWKMGEYETIAIVMGFGSFYNHSITPNALYFNSIASRTTNFVALEDIDVGEEITIDYGYKIKTEDIRMH